MDIYLRIDNGSIPDTTLKRLLAKDDYIKADDFIEI